MGVDLSIDGKYFETIADRIDRQSSFTSTVTSVHVESDHNLAYAEMRLVYHYSGTYSMVNHVVITTSYPLAEKVDIDFRALYLTKHKYKREFVYTRAYAGAPADIDFLSKKIIQYGLFFLTIYLEIELSKEFISER